MPLQILNERSHLDHGLSREILAYIKKRYAGCNGFMLETITLPKSLGTVESALYGPASGDRPIRKSDVYMSDRGLDRTWKSRMIAAPMRQTRVLTVIAGPMGEGIPCGLYTAYGGPAAPREPGDPSMNRKETAEAKKFWSVHALADGSRSKKNPKDEPQEVWLAKLQHWDRHGVQNRLHQLLKNRAPVKFKRSSGKIQEGRLEQVGGFGGLTVTVGWHDEAGPLYKTIDTEDIIALNKDYFIGVPDPTFSAGKKRMMKKNPKKKRAVQRGKVKKSLSKTVAKRKAKAAKKNPRKTAHSQSKLEGPFTFASGREVYWDPGEGKYYDRSVDLYLSDKEADALWKGRKKNPGRSSNPGPSEMVRAGSDKYLQSYEVTGSGHFPIDMLRYDFSWVDPGQDYRGRGTRTVLVHRYVSTKTARHRPTEGRWRSFGWSVGDVEYRKIDRPLKYTEIFRIEEPVSPADLGDLRAYPSSSADISRMALGRGGAAFKRRVADKTSTIRPSDLPGHLTLIPYGGPTYNPKNGNPRSLSKSELSAALERAKKEHGGTKRLTEEWRRRIKAKKKATKKKATKRKTTARKSKAPTARELVSDCRKHWEHYCERPNKTRLRAVLKHLEAMKASSAKSVKAERSRCLRAANAEAKRLKYTRKK